MEPKISFDFETTHLIIQKISFIDSFKGEWNVIIESENPKLEELTHKALAISSAATVRLDGEGISDDAASRLLDNISTTPSLSDAQGRVVGVHEALSHVLKDYKTMPLTEDTLFQLHSALVNHDNKERETGGKYKTSPNTEISDEPRYEHQLFYNTTVRFIVHKETNELLDWMNRELNNRKIHPLILTAWFVYEFLAIHPFQYGNGRIAKMLTTLLLLKDKYHFIRYMPLEKILEERKNEYFGVLIEGQRHRRRYTEREKISDWVIFFMECLELAIRKLEATHSTLAAQSKGQNVSAPILQQPTAVPQAVTATSQPVVETVAEEKKTVYLNDRQKKILEYITLCGPVKIGDITREYPDISRNTIKKDLLHFQNSNLTNQIGRGRGTYYTGKKK